MLSAQQEDKKLVKQYKKTNKILRRQLQSLNQQIDSLILHKSNRMGLQKLPKVQKQITNVKVIHYEVENLKKRLQHIKHDNQEYKKKIIVDWLQKCRELETVLQQKIHQKQKITIRIKIYERRLKEEKSQVNLRRQEDKLLQKIEVINEQLQRAKKMQRDLKASISIQQKEQHRKLSYLQQLQSQQQKLLEKSRMVQPKKTIEQKSIPKGQILDNEWQQLKKEFLTMKQAKQQQQMFLYEQNERLRKQIKFMNQQLKIKINRVDIVRKYNNLQPQKKLSSRLQRLNQRNTIDATNVNSDSRKKRIFSNVQTAKHQSVRYRDRNNSLNYD